MNDRSELMRKALRCIVEVLWPLWKYRIFATLAHLLDCPGLLSMASAGSEFTSALLSHVRRRCICELSLSDLAVLKENTMRSGSELEKKPHKT